MKKLIETIFDWIEDLPWLVRIGWLAISVFIIWLIAVVDTLPLYGNYLLMFGCWLALVVIGLIALRLVIGSD